MKLRILKSLAHWVSAKRAWVQLRHSKQWILFRDALRHSDRYAEYGSGASTVFADRTGTRDLVSVETDPIWANRLRLRLSQRARIVHVDLGPVGPWGRPQSLDFSDNFERYFAGAFIDKFAPDTILIDGRFRVACFLTCLLRADKGTRIIWDDYVHRPSYQIVEKILQPHSVTKRQALCVVPGQIPTEDVQKMLADYRLVMD